MMLRDITRTYADGVRRGQYDADLTKRQARMTAVILATLSNDGAATNAYPVTDDVRDAILRRAMDTMWTANVSALMTVSGPAVSHDYSIAVERAVTIFRGI